MPLSRRQFLQWSLVGAASMPLAGVAAQGIIRCPIVMYHSIGTPPPEAGATRRDLTLATEQFAAQLDTLLALGATTITMRQFWAGLSGAAALPPKPIALTFDDGYADAYSNALPLLQQRGMVGTVYLVSSYMEAPGFLTWGQAAEMQAAGHEMGCHSATHPDFSRLGENAQRQEITTATEALQNTLGIRPTSFCYPHGRYSRVTPRLLAEAGFTHATTTQHSVVHRTSSAYALGRIRIRSTTSVATFRAAVNVWV
jgi:peptidoglycan/xylan/chitin deacetylase (PgdA/CDA1 family)